MEGCLINTPHTSVMATSRPVTSANMFIVPLGPVYADENAEDDSIDRVGGSYAGKSEQRKAGEAFVEYRRRVFKETIRLVQHDENVYDSVKPLQKAWFVLCPTKNSLKKNGKVLPIQRIKMKIPQTFVFGETDSIVHFFTDSDGYLCREDGANEKIIEHFMNYTASKTPIPGAVAISKTPSEGYHRNEIDVLDPKGLKQFLTRVTPSTLQAVVFPRNGAICSVLRVTWQREQPMTAFLLSSRLTIQDPREVDYRKLVVHSAQFELTTINKRLPSEEWTEIMQRLVDCFEANSRGSRKLATLTADFIEGKDRQDHTLLQIKAFTWATPTRDKWGGAGMPSPRKGMGASPTFSPIARLCPPTPRKMDSPRGSLFFPKAL